MARPGNFDFYCEEALTGKTLIKKVYESDSVLAFYHTKPAYSTHIVIIPKEHIHDLKSASSELLTEIMNVAQQILKKIDVDTDGGRVITNLGRFQDTPHLHFHVIGDGKYPDINLSS